MLIDKSKFLVLVAAISAASAACVIVDGDSDDDGFGGDGQGAGNEGGGTTQSTSTGNDGGGGAGGGPECLDNTGTPDACDSTCEALTNCNGTPSMKEGVEEAFVDCVNALDPTSCSQTTDVLEGCFFDAVAQTCADDASEEVCGSASAACGNPGSEWDGNCLAIADALNASGQALWGACLEDTCADFSAEDALSFCIYDVVLPVAQ